MMKRSYRISRLTNVATYFMIILAIYMATSPIYVQGALTGTVSGRVVDEYDQGMKNVEIKVYSSDGAYAKSGSTSFDGSFTRL